MITDALQLGVSIYIFEVENKSMFKTVPLMNVKLLYLCHSFFVT